MSMAYCENCNAVVNTDDDPNFYSNHLCEYCRELLDEAEDRRLDDPRHGQAAGINRKPDKY